MGVGVPVRSRGVGGTLFTVDANCALGADGAEVGAGLRGSEGTEVVGAVGVPLRDLSS